MPAAEQFTEKLRASLQEGTFIKLTLSSARKPETNLRNVYGRLVQLRVGCKLSLVWHYATRDITKNFVVDEAIQEVRRLLLEDFERARLFTTLADWQLRCDPGAGSLKAAKPALTVAPAPNHDRLKPRSFSNTGAHFLQALGVTGPGGEPRPGMADKLRQIQRFAEILGHLLDGSVLKSRAALTAIDMGSGKGYLTFATYEYLRQRGIDANVTGVEARQDLVDLTNRVARESGAERLRFCRGAIGDFSPPAEMDILIALHACNTATDDALFQGIRAGASLILVAPCCHQELRSQVTSPAVLQDVFRHGILCDREAEVLTDSIRALLLEIAGYDASIFEFISLEHTGKNLMISAQKRTVPKDAAAARQRLRGLLDFYGIREQRLARLLAEL